jgi:capsule polysaccharide export protein KpsE/RkpR
MMDQNTTHELWIEYNRGYRKALHGYTVSGDVNDKANVRRQRLAQLHTELAAARADFHQIITEMHPHRHPYMANCLGEITALRRQIERNS